MLALVQRVAEASVTVDGEVVGAIGPGLLVLVCAQPFDTEASADRLLDKLLKLRIFGDDAGRMNRALPQVDGGGLLLVSQFTLAADTTGGNRPSFTGAAEPGLARRLFDHLVARAQARHPRVASGRFATHMRVALVNDGPVTLPLQVA